MRTRLKPGTRKQQILEAAIGQAHATSYQQMTRDQIADRCAVSRGLITPHYYPTMGDLRAAVMRAAVERRILGIVMQGLAARDPVALAAPDDLKKSVAELLL